MERVCVRIRIIRFSLGLMTVLFFLFVFTPHTYGHPDIWLKNEQGDRITPLLNHVDPYSPRRTCGGCHSYQLITSGYHFTQGFDVMSDDFDRRDPWKLSPGMFGRWLPTAAAGRISPKVNRSSRDLDLSTYDWIGRGGKYTREGKLIASACGFCHPGGGPLEFGRDRRGRADFSQTLDMAETKPWPRFDGDYSAIDTPDGKSLFRLSGTVPADCLICHRHNYDMTARNLQLSKRNYRWAATAGARLGSVSGAIFTYVNSESGPTERDFFQGRWNMERRPVVTYHWSDRGLFTAEGRLKGSIIADKVPTRNCLQCHELGERKNTGTVHTAENDVHIQKGFLCTDCHPLVGSTRKERLAHNIAKGHSPTNTVRDDLDGKDMSTCTGCHLNGKYERRRPQLPPLAKSPTVTHNQKFSGYRFHTYILDCMACHAPYRTGRALLLLDMSAGYEATYTTDRMETIAREEDYSIPTVQPWSPWMKRLTRYQPTVPKWLLWFGNEERGTITPIPLRFVRRAANNITGLSTVKASLPRGGILKYRTVTEEKEIQAMLLRLKRLGFSNPVYLTERKYRLSANRVISDTPSGHTTLYYSIEHGVIGKGALGACGQCHAPSAPFFTRQELVNSREFLHQDYPVMKEPNALPQYKLWGMKDIPLP